MRVLYVTGTCLTRNTSANISHNAFVQGLLENKCEVDIIMAQDSWGREDKALPVWEKARYFTFRSITIADRIRRLGRNFVNGAGVEHQRETEETVHTYNRTKSAKGIIKSVCKKSFLFVFRPDPIYPLEKKWLKTAARFKAETKYDIVISNSSPAASHRLVEILRNKRRISFDRWIQIWEDPWYHDLYGGHSEIVEDEERRLLKCASEVAYVSPLTLMYQKRFYPECAKKMYCIPLPFLAPDIKEDEDQEQAETSFGYFGDYYSYTRNLIPFYEALNETGLKGCIFGDSDLSLASTDMITVSERVTLDLLKEIQIKTGVLVHLSNLRGGQIPGKIYHYSATDKPILFILDGTDEEKTALKEYFGKFLRYCFCNNTSDDIAQAMRDIAAERRIMEPVEEFAPFNVVRKLLVPEKRKD